MANLGIIYLAVNRVNQKAYVGQTKIRAKARIGNHISVAVTKDSTAPFHRAIRKYGIESFDFAVLEERLFFVLDDRETYWIKHLGSKVPHGYNRTDGGQGTAGCEYTPARREAIRQSQLGDKNRMKNPETAKKHGDAIRGSNHPFFGKFGSDHPQWGKRHKLPEEERARRKEFWNRPENVAKRKEMALGRVRNSKGQFGGKICDQ